jgi:ribose-phosphate pyrophosphokinase
MKNDADTKIVLGFPADQAAARRFASRAGLSYADIAVHHFPDGESLVRLPESLPPDTVLYGSLDHPNERLIELELAAATAVRLGAARLTLVAPYLCYMRQDIAFHSGEAISQQVIGAMLARHFDTLITIDPHLHRTSHLDNAVPVRRAIALSAAPLMTEWLKARAGRPLVIGPDEESLQWVAAIAAPTGLPYAVASKTRLGDRDVRIELPEMEYRERDVVLVDDVASTGRTLAGAARQIAARGARSITVLVSHALFVGDALEQLRAAGVSEIHSTDSIAHPTNSLHLDTVLADAMRTID